MNPAGVLQHSQPKRVTVKERAEHKKLSSAEESSLSQHTTPESLFALGVFLTPFIIPA